MTAFSKRVTSAAGESQGQPAINDTCCYNIHYTFNQVYKHRITYIGEFSR